MRKALVGFSTPLFYDYAHQADRADSDTWDSPNPVLDSPFGLMLLFDEIWFVCRSLCPQNMRNLPFVHFLDEEGCLPSMGDVTDATLSTVLKESPMFAGLDKENIPYRPAANYQDTLRSAGVYWDGALDNHTHSLTVGGITHSGDSFRFDNLLLDLLLLRRLNDPDMELATNSFSQFWLEQPGNSGIRAKLTELLVIDGIPNYLSPEGPYHPCVDEIRSSQYLTDFRKWMTRTTKAVTAAEIHEVKETVEAEMQTAYKKVFKHWLDPRGFYWSFGKALVGEGAGFLLPGSGLLMTAWDEGKKLLESHPMRWQGFMIDAQDAMPKIGRH